MPDVALITVQHSASRFMREVLQSGGLEVWLEHTWSRGRGRYREALDSGLPIVTTVRPLWKILNSWADRDGPTRELRSQYATWRAEVLPRALAVEIDSENRDRQLAAVGESLGVQLSTDWEPVGHGC